MEKFFCVLGIYDGATQHRLEEYQRAILDQGFAGRQTMGIPFHVTLGTFGLERREELLEKLRGLCMEPVEVFFNHMGMFEGQRVLFLADRREEPGPAGRGDSGGAVPAVLREDHRRGALRVLPLKKAGGAEFGVERSRT